MIPKKCPTKTKKRLWLSRETRAEHKHFSQTFSGNSGVSEQNPGISRQKVCFPLVSRVIPNFLAPTPSCGRTPPHQRISGAKVWAWAPFFCLNLQSQWPKLLLESKCRTCPCRKNLTAEPARICALFCGHFGLESVPNTLFSGRFSLQEEVRTHTHSQNSRFSRQTSRKVQDTVAQATHEQEQQVQDRSCIPKAAQIIWKYCSKTSINSKNNCVK